VTSARLFFKNVVSWLDRCAIWKTVAATLRSLLLLARLERVTSRLKSCKAILVRLGFWGVSDSVLWRYCRISLNNGAEIESNSCV